MKKLYIENLSLENYRNFKQYEITTDARPVIIIGKNGSGKTNILEAISLIFPGKGLRNSKFEEICKYDQKYWLVKSQLQSKLGCAQIESNFLLETNKRKLLFNGSKIAGNELSKLTNVVWLTPQMDGIFLEPPKFRRRFFDRIVYSFDENHANKVAKYEYYTQERNKILLDHPNDHNWLKTIEYNIATLALEILRSRFEILNELQQVMKNSNSPFPKANLLLVGNIEQNIIEQQEENILDFIINQFASTRFKDKLSGKTSYGVHKTDFIVTHSEKNILAKLCSTGEQKALLIAIILAQINLVIKRNYIKPIILFDEAFVHLDGLRKDYLIQFFQKIDAQIWITATDINGIEKLVDTSQLLEL